MICRSSDRSSLPFRSSVSKIVRHVKSNHDTRQPPPAVVTKKLISTLRYSWRRVVVPAVAMLSCRWQLAAAVVDGDGDGGHSLFLSSFAITSTTGKPINVRLLRHRFKNAISSINLHRSHSAFVPSGFPQQQSVIPRPSFVSDCTSRNKSAARQLRRTTARQIPPHPQTISIARTAHGDLPQCVFVRTTASISHTEIPTSIACFRFAICDGDQ